MIMETETPTFDMVLNATGLEIYCFLHPKDLFHLSLTSHSAAERIHNTLIQVALRQLPLVLESNQEQVEYQVVKVSKEHSFTSREQLLNHVLQKVECAELKFAGQTTEESSINARQVLNTEKKPGIYGATFMSETNSRFPDPEYAHVGYNYQENNRYSAAIRCNDILKRILSMEQFDVVLCWMDYLFALNSLTIGSWFWTCRHRNLDFQGVEGKGITISFPETGETLELQCSILARKVDQEEDSSTNCFNASCVVADTYEVVYEDTDGSVVYEEADVVVDGVVVYEVPDGAVVYEYVSNATESRSTSSGSYTENYSSYTGTEQTTSDDRVSSLTNNKQSTPTSLSSSTDDPDGKQRFNAYRAEVEALVRRVVPDEIDEVDAIMIQFSGREEELIAALRGMQENDD